MSDDQIGYNDMVDEAMLNVVRQAVDFAVENGLPGTHHFYITFRTTEPGVDIADYLREKYPSEMTIVLQHQYRDLVVDDEGFSISLSFNDVNEHLRIPFASLNAFADPSVNFGLQFRSSETPETPAVDDTPAEPGPGAPSLAATPPAAPDGGEPGAKVAAPAQSRPHYRRIGPFRFSRLPPPLTVASRFPKR